ncbi:MAG TPA: pyridoxamine 5'-phosphate oxidase family protein [Candidatus Limnocylindria bacterium]
MKHHLAGWIGEHLGCCVQRPSTEAEGRPSAAIDRRLRRESVVLLGAAAGDEPPELVPTWFSWDGALLWVFAPHDEAWVASLRSRPRVMLALGDPEQGGDVQLIEGEASLLSTPTSRALTDIHRAKYADRLAERGEEWPQYAAAHPRAVVIRPTRYLRWPAHQAPTAPAPGPTLAVTAG